MDPLLIIGAIIAIVAIVAIVGIVVHCKKCLAKIENADQRVEKSCSKTESATHQVAVTEEIREDGSTHTTVKLVENENGEEKMVADCSDLEQKIKCLEDKLAEYEAEKNAIKAAAEKEANQREMYEAMQRIGAEKYQPTVEQLAEVEAKNKAAEFDANVEEIFARMIQLKGDELVDLFAEKMKAGDEELFKAFIQKIKEDYDPALIKALIDQYDAMVIDEEVQPIIQTVRDTTTEQYVEERRKKKQAFSDAVVSAIREKLCPKAKEEPEAEN